MNVYAIPSRFVVVMSMLLGFGFVSLSMKARADEGTTFFEKNIRSLLNDRCGECHSKESKKLKGGLRLDFKAGWLKGGDRGPAIEPGKPQSSLLVQAVRYDDDDLKMPPAGKLSPHEIALLTQWVAMGAPDPRVDEVKPSTRGPINIEQGRKFWAFRAPVDPTLPVVKDESRPRATLDRFILSALEEKGLTPNHAADRRTLIRRATFDLIGLPPTPSEIDAFLADEAPDAFEKVIDRLLASPAYGERWGRHWLDVARYADSNGLDENVAYGNAWRYRDYVINSFNQDKPFDRFLVEQVAGDLIPADPNEPESHERIIATGFLALGPKVLAEVDETKMEMDIVDEQIEAVGRAFMGLTIGCARCHDHKFDPIATTDYYALAGIFRSTRTMESFKKVARWHENPLLNANDRARLAEIDKKIAERKKEIEELIRYSNERLQSSKGKEFVLPKDPSPLYSAETKAELKRLRDGLSALEKTQGTFPTAMGVGEGHVANARVHIRGSHMALGDEVPRRVPRVLAAPDSPSFGNAQSGRLELARWLTGSGHPLTSRVIVNRVWRWHFGRGIVGTPDNFGALGERPSNPALLDWLALRFVEEGWSIKSLHRLIMNSSTYQLSATYDPKAGEIDPENRLLWRFRPRRLEAEAIRDALLAVSGTLDPTMTGSLLQVENRAYFFDHTSKDATKYDTRRRSVYLPIVRNHMYDVFDLFDYSEASVSNGDRASTTVAPQALFMMNGDLVATAAHDLADELTALTKVEAERIRRLYLRAYGRPAKPEEIARAEAFLARYSQALGATEPASSERSVRSWQALCQMILASNEFVYLD